MSDYADKDFEAQVDDLARMLANKDCTCAVEDIDPATCKSCLALYSPLRCDECGATFANSKMGSDALWSHCCQ